MEVKATLEERTSKSGKNYQVLVVHLTDTYEKLVFLEKAETELLKAKKETDDVPSFLR